MGGRSVGGVLEPDMGKEDQIYLPFTIDFSGGSPNALSLISLLGNVEFTVPVGSTGEVEMAAGKWQIRNSFWEEPSLGRKRGRGGRGLERPQAGAGGRMLGT